MADVALTASAVDATDGTSFTFSSQDFGVAQANRHIIVGVVGRSVTGIAITGVTIAGIAATQVIAAALATPPPSTDLSHASLWIAAVPTGTSGDVVVTFDGTVGRCGIGVWRAVGLNSATATATATDGDTSNPQTASIAVGRGGIQVGVGYTNNGATWSGLTEAYETNMETTGANSNDHTGAFISNAPAAATTSVSLTSGTDLRQVLVVAAWAARPSAPAFRHRTRFFKRAF